MKTMICQYLYIFKPTFGMSTLYFGKMLLFLIFFTLMCNSLGAVADFWSSH
uniref:Uncharacterized protein n=1 Tax=Arundo donax TaxID=35708 RepID=A0A0A9G4J0_ARUDO